MSYIRFPRQREWRGMFDSKFAGEIYESFNIDLERSKGRVALGDKARIIQSDTDVFTMGTPQKFLKSNADGNTRDRKSVV